MIDAESILSRPGALWLDTATPLGSATGWSFLAAEPAVRVRLVGDELLLSAGPSGDRGLLRLFRECDPGEGEPFERLASLWRRASAALRVVAPDGAPEDAPFAPVFRGGLAGVLSYDLGRRFEQLPARLPDAEPWDLELGLFDEVLALRADGGPWFRSRLMGPGGTGGGPGLVASERGGCWSLAPAPARPVFPGPFAPDLDQEAHTDGVRSIRSAIRDGDVYQVNLTFRARGPADPEGAAAVHRRLRRDNPAPYAAFLDLPGRRLVSASPEAFLLLDREGRVRSRPIKGTRPRSDDPVEDEALREELLASAKDDAELAMIIDLVRNDLARVCVPGSVTRERQVVPEGHPTVWHTVGEVDGRLRPDRDVWDLLRASFPPGSCIGAPKIRAFGHIERLETSRRGPYTGSIGWIGADGGAALSVAIRTLVFDADSVCFGAGGGIVHDSDPDSEWLEARLKTRALEAALRGDRPPGESRPSASKT